MTASESRHINVLKGSEAVTWWMIVLIIIGVILIIQLIAFLYVSAIAKKDGQASDPNYTKIAFAAQDAAKLLKQLNQENRSLICRVTRGILGVRIEVSSSGEPPVHYDREVQLEQRPEEEMRKLIGYAAQSIAYFSGNMYIPMQEYGDSYRLDKNLYYVPPQTPGQGGAL